MADPAVAATAQLAERSSSLLPAQPFSYGLNRTR
jgi:hypothetical protein